MRFRVGVPRRAALGIAALGLGACVLLAARRLPGSFGAAPVATIEVVRGSFVRDVRAEGTLKSVQATPIVVPPVSGRSQRVAFVARDGAPVKEGEVVVRFDPFEVEKEAADGRADLRAASSKIDKTKAEADKTRRGHDLDRALAEEDLDRARTFVLLDEAIFSRHERIESALDRVLYEKKAATASSKLEASGRLATTDLALDRIETGKARFRVTEAEKGLTSDPAIRPRSRASSRWPRRAAPSRRSSTSKQRWPWSAPTPASCGQASESRPTSASKRRRT